MLCGTPDCSCRRLLEKFKIFTAFYHLSELKSREDLIKIIIQNLDYSMYAALTLFCTVFFTLLVMVIHE